MKKYKWVSILMIIVFVLGVTGVNTDKASAADTPNVLGGGICINEVLIDPNGTLNFDTDNNLTADTLDEFIELYNLSGSIVDISGWQLWDSGNGNWFTFPGAPGSSITLLAPGAYAFVIIGVQAGGSLPVMTNPASIAFDAGRGGGVLNNGGDNVVLLDPSADQYIQLLYNGDTPDNPPVDYVANGFSATATLAGTVEDWGNDQDGVSITRYPSGDDNIILHTATPGGGQASPNAILLYDMSAKSNGNLAVMSTGVLALLFVSIAIFLFHRRKTV